MGQPIHMIIPFKNQGAKSRLASVLTPWERQLLSFAMLMDVLDAVSGLGRATVLSRPGLNIADIGSDVEIQESELDLNDALNSLISCIARHGWPSDILIVMADLALLTEKDVVGILNCDGDVVLCPGRGGGNLPTGMAFPQSHAGALRLACSRRRAQNHRGGKCLYGTL